MTPRLRIWGSAVRIRSGAPLSEAFRVKAELQSVNLPILAEGVETEAQHRFLVQEGCDEVQGYLTGRPLPIADYAKQSGRRVIGTSSSPRPK